MTFRRNPFEEIERMLERMSQQFEQAAGEWEPSFEPAGFGSIAVDVEDHADEIIVTADLPGYKKEDIDVTLSGDTIRIRAEREEESEERGGEFIRQERRRQSVSRALSLPEPVDEENVRATYKNGVLTVTLAKTHRESGKSIDIE